jgi:hypothetical protein
MKRGCVVVVMVALAGCGDDGGGSCTGPVCVKDAAVDGAPASCGPSAGCTTGPSCGGACCKQGERCDNGTCMCGMNAACPVGDTCEAAGPLGNDTCGSICCGATGPCPN